MKKFTLLTILAVLIGIYPSSRSAQAQRDNIQAGKTCSVTDPTGTPLNVRLRPNGKIINRIRNGRNIYIQSVASDSEGKPWVLVATKTQGNYKMVGYVLREFISCY